MAPVQSSMASAVNRFNPPGLDHQSPPSSPPSDCEYDSAAEEELLAKLRVLQEKKKKKKNALAPKEEQDCGLEEEFMSYVATLSKASRKTYWVRVKLYKLWCMQNDLDYNFPSVAAKYVVEELREKQNMKANTIWCEQAKIGTWFRFVHKITFLDKEPGLKVSGLSLYRHSIAPKHIHVAL